VAGKCYIVDVKTWRGVGGIYVITNVITGDRYYGSARCLDKRFKEHARRLRQGTHHNVPLQVAWIQYGESAISFRPLAILEQDQVRDTEQRLLDLMYGKEHCYNVSRDARSPMTGRKQTPEHTAKVAAANRGRKRPQYAIDASVAAHRGKVLSSDHREKLSRVQAGRKRPAHLVALTAASHKGRKRSAETCERIAASRRGWKPTEETLAKFAAAKIGRRRSPESVAKTAAAHRGKPRTDTERAAISAGMTEAGRQKLSEQKVAYWAAWRAKKAAIAS
jgi:group I intron endonuclease